MGMMTLLCVDDDPEDIELFVEAVRLLGVQSTFLSASNGKDALKIMDKIYPDYVFLDINMPVMDGKETLLRIREDKRLKTVPVYIFSTSDNQNELEHLKQLGANKCITKPSTFTGLCCSLSTILKNNGAHTC
jgi:CheY-like chemotaxis protein